MGVSLSVTSELVMNSAPQTSISRLTTLSVDICRAMQDGDSYTIKCLHYVVGQIKEDSGIGMGG